MKINELGYEEALKRLEELMTELEDESLKLDESVEKFKDAMELYKHCRDILTKAEGDVKIILEKGGKIEEIDFEGLSEEVLDESF